MSLAIARQQADLVLFTGDYLRDALKLEARLNLPIHSVAGNCDPPGGESEKIIELEGCRFYLVHGHQWGVKKSLQSLFYRAEEVGAQVVVFGHTHLPYCRQTEGIWMLNPGSPTHPRSLSPRGTYLLLNLEADTVNPSLLVL